MIGNESVNWVRKARLCTCRGVLDALYSQIRNDVNEASQIPYWIGGESRSFVVEKFKHEIRVEEKILPSPIGHMQWVEFTSNQLDKISVRYGPYGDNFNIQIIWNSEDAECELHVDGKPMPLWKISQKALEKFLINRQRSNAG